MTDIVVLVDMPALGGGVVNSLVTYNKKDTFLQSNNLKVSLYIYLWVCLVYYFATSGILLSKSDRQPVVSQTIKGDR